MLDLNDRKQLALAGRRFVKRVRKSRAYRQSQEDIDTAKRYRKGDQMPKGYDRNAHFPVLVMNTIAADLDRNAALVIQGNTQVRFYPKRRDLSVLDKGMIAEAESWQYFEAFKETLAQVAHRTFDQGFAATVFSVDAFQRVGDDLPRIRMDVPDSTRVGVDPAANDPKDPLLGGRGVFVWDSATFGDLEAEYGDSKIYSEPWAKISQMKDERYDNQRDAVELYSPEIHPLRAMLRDVAADKGGQFVTDEPEGLDDDYEFAKVTVVLRTHIRYERDGEPRIDKTFVRLVFIANLSDLELESAVLVEAAIAEFNGNPSIILTCPDPPYGMPVVKMIKGPIDAKNMANSAALQMIGQMARIGTRFGIIKQAWSQEQLTAFETRGTTPTTFVFDGAEMQSLGMPPDVRAAFKEIDVNFPNLAPVLDYASYLDAGAEKVMASPWTVTGQANPSSRFSGAAIGMMQDAVKLTKEIMSAFIGRSANNHMRTAWGLIRKYWIAPHRVIGRGPTPHVMNMVAADPRIANMIMQDQLEMDGAPVRLTGVRARLASPPNEPRSVTYPLPEGLDNVLDDPQLGDLIDRPDVEAIAWEVNGIDSIETEIEMLIEAESALRDQEDASRMQAMISLGIPIAPEYAFNVMTGSRRMFSWEENLEMQAKNTKMLQLAQLSNEDLDGILAVVARLRPQNGQGAPQQMSNAPQAALPAANVG